MGLFGGIEWGIVGALGGHLGAPGGFVGSSSDILGVSWAIVDVLGASWGYLGRGVLGYPWVSWGYVGALGRLLELVMCLLHANKSECKTTL